MPKTLQTRIQQKYDFESNWKNVESTFKPYKGEVIVYASDTTDAPKIKVGNGSSYLGSLPFLSTGEDVEPVKTINKPAINTVYTYTGNTQTVTISGYNENTMTISDSSTISATNVGTYHVYVSPKGGYSWSDGTANQLDLVWSIDKATVEATIGQTTLSIDGDTWYILPITFNPSVDLAGEAVTINSSNTSVVYSGTTYIDGTGKEFDGYVAGNGTATITVSFEGNNNINAFTTTNSCTITVTNLISRTLNDNDWATISKISQAGTGYSYWSHGDVKQLTSADNTYLPNSWAYIVDLPPSSVAASTRKNRGITFEISCCDSDPRTNDNKKYALIDSYYYGKESDYYYDAMGYIRYRYDGSFYLRAYIEESINSALDYSWSDQPVQSILNQIEFGMTSTIRNYLRDINTVYIPFELPNYWNNEYQKVTLATPYQTCITSDPVSQESTWQFSYYLTGNGGTSTNRKRYGAYYSTTTKKWVKYGSSPITYFLRPVSGAIQSYAAPGSTGAACKYYINTSGTAIGGGSGTGELLTSAGIVPIFRI